MRDPRQASGATFLDLFFDLAFVFAFTRLSQELTKQVTWHGAWETLVTLLALWWVWAATVWLTDEVDPDRPITQVLVILMMFGSLVLAAAVPEAYGRHGTIFAVGYVGMEVVRNLFMLFALRGRELHRSYIQALIWLVPTGALWLVGGATTGHPRRDLLWSVAILIEYVGSTLGWPVPGLRRVRFFTQPVGGEHLSERYRQFLIIALGDMVLVSAISFTDGGLTAYRWAAFVSAFLTAVLLWRIYIYRAGELLGRAISVAEQPAWLGYLAALAHLVMVAGIVVTTVGNELTIAHPFADWHLAWTVVLVAGPALFLVGRVLFERTVFRRTSRTRVIGFVLLLLAFPTAKVLPLLAAAALINLVLLGIAVVNTVSWRYRPVPVHGSTP